MSDLWKDGRTTLGFWARGNYSIVPGRHIGLDQAPTPAGQLWSVPALRASRVVRSVQTKAIGRVVVTDTGRSRRRYISYCHGFYGDPAPEGTSLAAGDRVMRLAGSNESPGTSWGGVHCHVVVHDKIGGAYLTGQDDTYYDPAQELADYRASTSGGGSTPFPVPTPTEEDELMGAKEDIIAAVNADTARLRLEIRGHIFYDAGVNGTDPCTATTKNAAIINAAGRIIVMDSNPLSQEASIRRDLYKYTDASRTAEQNRVALDSRTFWNKIKDELTARGNDFYTVADAQAWFAKRQAQIAAQ